MVVLHNLWDPKCAICAQNKCWLKKDPLVGQNSCADNPKYYQVGHQARAYILTIKLTSKGHLRLPDLLEQNPIADVGYSEEQTGDALQREMGWTQQVVDDRPQEMRNNTQLAVTLCDDRVCCQVFQFDPAHDEDVDQIQQILGNNDEGNVTYGVTQLLRPHSDFDDSCVIVICDFELDRGSLRLFPVMIQL